MEWPQIVVICLFAMTVGINLSKHGESGGNHNFWASLLNVAIYTFLLKAGGFF